MLDTIQNKPGPNPNSHDTRSAALNNIFVKYQINTRNSDSSQNNLKVRFVAIDASQSNKLNAIFLGNYSENRPKKIALIENTAYVTDYQAGVIHVIRDLRNGNLSQLDDIYVGEHPTDITANTINNKIFVPFGDGNRISVIDGNFNRKTKDIILNNYSPNSLPNIDIDIKNNIAYMTNPDSNIITVINGSNNDAAGYLALGQSDTFGNTQRVNSVGVNPNTNKIYVANSGSDTISVIDGVNDKVLNNNIKVGNHPTYVAVNHITNKIYVVNSQNITVVDGSSDKAVKNIQLSHLFIPISIIADSENNTLYVADVVWKYHSSRWKF